LEEGLNPYLEQIRLEYELKRSLYEGYAAALEVFLRQLCNSRNIEPQAIEARGKEPSSLLEKLRKYPNYKSLDNITDLTGARIVLYYRSDIQAARDLICDEFEVLDEVSHGAEAAEAFGYQSLHLNVRLDDRRRDLVEWSQFSELQAEIQVRTVLAHAWAAISHKLDYKSSSEIPHQIRRKLFRVAALLETGDDLFGEFRTEVEALRESYRSDATSEREWLKLELNLDSLVASWSRLPIEKVRETALQAGFRAPIRSDDPEARRKDIGDLVSIADAAGYQSVGDIAKVVGVLQKRKGDLKEIADRADDLGFRPFAVAADVISTLVLLENPHLLDQETTASFKQEFRQAIKETAMAG
jgi:putative GTP pyrophosphokinase